MERCAFATVAIARHGRKSTEEAVVGQAGVIITSRHDPLTPPEHGAGWGYGHSMKTITMDTLPVHSGVVIHPGEQRFFVRNTLTGENARLSLDLTNSEQRDRFMLHNDMDIRIRNSKNGSEKVLHCLIPLGGNSDPDSSWHKKITKDGFWTVRANPGKRGIFSENNNNSLSDASSTNTPHDWNDCVNLSQLGEAQVSLVGHEHGSSRRDCFDPQQQRKR